MGSPSGCATLLLVLAVGVPITGEAQEIASSLDDLRALVKVGDDVIVSDLQGRETQGRIVGISPSSLGLIVGGVRTDFAADALDTVSRRDSRWNGTLIKGRRLIYSRSQVSTRGSVTLLPMMG